MAILYLHGLMSKNISAKVDWLREQSHTVHNPKLNYMNESETIFRDLENLCEQNSIDLIVGSSMGGCLAYHLGNKFTINTLLFNPFLAMNSIKKPAIKMGGIGTVLHTVILGKNDDVVIPDDTLNFLEDAKVNFVKTFEDTGHRTPIGVFQKHFNLL